jgi:hypothetical protein
MIYTDDPVIAKGSVGGLINLDKTLMFGGEQGEYPGFDFHIKYNYDGTRPKGLIWMTPNMRENLIQYGDVLCFDMQSR